jgi:alkylated DNA repair dioxygenase AlkB
MKSPRLTAAAGRAGVCYRYAGTTHQATGWCWGLDSIVNELQRVADWTPNFVLLNLYRDGDDAMGWHADDERELGPEPTIASLSLGATRRFRFRRRSDRRETYSLTLAAGDLLLMWGRSQHDWQHAVPRTRQPVGPRINLTFRRILL